jgi:hypothetical protein
LTIKVLNTVRQEDQQATGSWALGVGSDEMVIELNEGLLYLGLGDPHQLSHEDHDRIEDLGDEAPVLMGKLDIPHPDKGNKKEKTSQNHDENQEAEKEREQGR